MRTIYLDNNATTAPHPTVIEAMRHVLEHVPGNPSSIHGPGQAARAVVDAARVDVAALLGARPTEIVFTSGGTEAINTALHACVQSAPTGSRRIIRSTVEHEAVIEAALHGADEVSVVGVGAEGRLDLAGLTRELARPACCVSLMLSNNETGVLLPIQEAAALARAARVPLHVDAVQAVGKSVLNVEEIGCDYLSIAAHKFHGPKGVGALFVRRGAAFVPLLRGASHESARRAGTENTAALAGMAAAARVMGCGISERRAHLRQLTVRLEALLADIPGVRFQGAGAERMPGTTNVAFEGLEGAGVVLRLAREGIAISSGSACSASMGGGSHVLEAMGVPYSHLFGAIRVSLCEQNTADEIDLAAAAIARAVLALRELLPGV